MKSKRRLVLGASAVLLVILGLVVWIPRRHVQLYKVTVLPSLPGAEFRPSSINDRGQIVGLAKDPSTVRLLFYDRENGIRDLGWATDEPCINNAGQIAGTTTDPNGNRQAFFWDPKDGKQILGTLDKPESVALALNNHGQVVGDLCSRSILQPGITLTKRQAFIWDKRDGMRKLFPHKQRESFATSINDAAQVIGSLATTRAGGHKHCFWDSTEAAMSPTLPLLPPIDFPTMHHDPGAIDLNNKGYVLGKMYRMGEDGHWDRDETWISLWTKEGGLKGIEYLFPLEHSVGSLRLNDANQVLYGEKHTSPFERLSRRYFGPYTHHYLWDPKRGKIVLDKQIPSKLGKLVGVRDINNRGCIIGSILLEHSGQVAGVLLEPIPKRWDE